MNYQQINEILDIFKDIPDPKRRDRAVQLMMKASSSGISFGSICSFVNSKTKKEQDKGTLLKFTPKEILKVSEKYRKEFFIDDYYVYCRKRKSGQNNINYEIRYRRNGYDIAVSSNDLQKAKQKFIDAINVAISQPRPEKKKRRKKSDPNYIDGVPTDFNTFAEYFFEKYRKRKVSATTFANDMYRYNKHIKPAFLDKRLWEISPAYCQEFLDGFAQKGMTKTNNEIYSILNGIFKSAIAHNLIKNNPLAIVIVEKHEGKHGNALTKDEERLLLEKTAGTRYQTLFALALYTGLRPNEYKTARIEGDFIVAVNSKRKNGKVEYKKIPITPMLRHYIEGVEKFDFPGLEYMRDNFNKVLPNHILYDLRTTFYTRCEECGVADAARDEFVGHSRGELNRAYSDLSDEYLLKEGKKLIW